MKNFVEKLVLFCLPLTLLQEAWVSRLSFLGSSYAIDMLSSLCYKIHLFVLSVFFPSLKVILRFPYRLVRLFAFLQTLNYKTKAKIAVTRVTCSQNSVVTNKKLYTFFFFSLVKSAKSNISIFYPKPFVLSTKFSIYCVFCFCQV